MVDVAISALPAQSPVASTDVLPLVEGGATKKATVADVVKGGGALLQDGTVAMTADLNLGGNQVANAGDAAAATDLTTLQQVQSLVAAGVSTIADWKQSVRLATATAMAASTRVGNVRTANANGAMATIDGVAPALNDRILDKDNATGADRGIWTVTSLGSAGSPWVMTRATDCDTSAEVTTGLTVVVEEGTLAAGKPYILTTANPITLGTTALTFTQLSSATAGNGLTGTSSLAVLAADTTIVVGAGGVKRAPITGDVTIADGSNVSAIANDAVTTVKILNNAVTLAKLATIAALTVIANATNATAVPTAVAAGADFNVFQRSGTTLAFGPIDLSQAGAVGSSLLSPANFANGSARSLFGRAANSSGVQASIPGGGANTVLVDNGTTLSFAALGLATLPNIATDSLLGRDTAGTGAVEVIGLNATLSMTGAGALQRAALTGDVTAPAGSNTTAIAAGVIVDADVNASAAIAYSKLANLAGLSVLGNAGSTTGAVSAITGTNGQVLVVTGTTLNFNQLDLSLSAAVTGTLPQTRGGTGFSGAGGTANRVFLTTDGTTATWTQVNLASAQVSGLLPFANIANGSALSVLARSANTSGVHASLAATTVGQVLGYQGTSLQWTTTIGDTATQIEAANLSGRAIVSLCLGADLTTTQMPALTGAGVAFLANATIEPTTGLPGGGNIVWCSNVTKKAALRTENPVGAVWDISPQGNWFRAYRSETGTTATASADQVIATVNFSGFGNGSGVCRIKIMTRDATNSFGCAEYEFVFAVQGGSLVSGSTSAMSLIGNSSNSQISSAKLGFPGSGNIDIKVTAADAVSYNHHVLLDIVFHPNAAG